jgi:GNAT superfamily N-acetyltransferase
MSLLINRPVELDARHDSSGFSCREEALDEYLHRFALINQQNGSSRTFVTLAEGAKIAGYYSLAASQILFADAPERVRKGLGRYPVPVILLAKLAVDVRWQGKGLGACLLRDAVTRIIEASNIVGVRAILVNAKNERASSFYEQYGFKTLQGNPLNLSLLLKDGKKTFGM